MRPDERDSAYLWDMREAAREAWSIVRQTDKDSFLRDRVLLLATERCLEIIGETAGRVSSVGREARPDIPWREVIAQRNILAHEYGHIDHNILYRTVIEDIPDLIKQLDAVLQPNQT